MVEFWNHMVCACLILLNSMWPPVVPGFPNASVLGIIPANFYQFNKLRLIYIYCPDFWKMLINTFGDLIMWHIYHYLYIILQIHIYVHICIAYIYILYIYIYMSLSFSSFFCFSRLVIQSPKKRYSCFFSYSSDFYHYFFIIEIKDSTIFK